MYKVQALNAIATVGLNQFPRNLYEVASEIRYPDAILVRSAIMHDMPIPETLRVVGRAGTGINNIPINEMTKRGIPVLNTPGANANAVKEMVIAGMLLASRNICQAWNFSQHLSGDNVAIHERVESEKKRFVGFELAGKTLGVIGLGNVGVKVANTAIALGMRVLGYDPTITTKRAWELSATVEQAFSIDSLLMQSEFVTFHVPLNKETEQMIHASRIQAMKPGMVVLNFAREGIIDVMALKHALDNKHLTAYVSDFPCAELIEHPDVINLPHIGASTKEAEENCATMVVKQIRDYLENGAIVNSVNFPTIEMPFTNGFRIAIVNANVPNMVAQISSELAHAGLNIIDLINKSRDDIAYTLIDLNAEISDTLMKKISSIEGVIQIRRFSSVLNTNKS